MVYLVGLINNKLPYYGGYVLDYFFGVDVDFVTTANQLLAPTTYSLCRHESNMDLLIYLSAGKPTSVFTKTLNFPLNRKSLKPAFLI